MYILVKYVNVHCVVHVPAIRHPYPQKTYDYTYRFRVPDSRAYDVSWTEFRNEKLEHYNWNYMDQYICTRGEDDNFQLTDVSLTLLRCKACHP